MTYLPQLDDFDTKMALLKTLLDISDGKVAFPLFFLSADVFGEGESAAHSRGHADEGEQGRCGGCGRRQPGDPGGGVQRALQPGEGRVLTGAGYDSASPSCVDPTEPAGARLGARAADHPEGEREGAEGGAHGRTAHRPTSP